VYNKLTRRACLTGILVLCALAVAATSCAAKPRVEADRIVLY
jgi:hypothetical protein